jgi:hypothetical protein
MSFKPYQEVLLALVMGVAVWGAVLGWHGFARYIQAALVLVAFGCIGAFLWKKSQH